MLLGQTKKKKKREKRERIENRSGGLVFSISRFLFHFGIGISVRKVVETKDMKRRGDCGGILKQASKPI